jgi:hypothetical protein
LVSNVVDAVSRRLLKLKHSLLPFSDIPIRWSALHSHFIVMDCVQCDSVSDSFCSSAPISCQTDVPGSFSSLRWKCQSEFNGKSLY